MSQDMLAQFLQLVFTDKSLQEQLQKIESRKEFIALVIRLGHKNGYDFTVEDVEDALRAATSAWLQRWT